MKLKDRYQISTFQTKVQFIDQRPPLASLGDFFIFDENTLPLFEPIPPNSVVIPAGEKHKQLSTVETILERMLEAGLARDSRLVGIGGGVMTDMSAFAASLYMRGCKLTLLPTTLLAMVDAAFGGKTGVDFKKYKNTVGSFYPAETLIIWPGALKTLSQKEYVSGLAESLKAALLKDEELWKLFLEKREAILSREPEVLKQVLEHSIAVKGVIVEEDMRESGIRAHLNLGHTFGHALETVTNFGVMTHGEAVCWGIAKAMDTGVHLGETEKSYAREVKETLEAYGFSLKTPKIEIESLLSAMEKDKKKKDGSVRFVLQHGPQDTFLTPVDREVIRKVLEEPSEINQKLP
jgi:3-dehydroquinate synthase